MGSASSVSPITVWSLRLAPATTTESGVPRASVSRLRLVPHLARSVGLGAVFPPTEGGLAPRPIHPRPLPVEPLQPVIGQKPCLPERFEYPGLGPFLKAAMGGGRRADPGGVQGIPLTASAQHEEDRIHRCPVRRARSMAAQRMRWPRR